MQQYYADRESLIIELDEKGLLFPDYQLLRVNGELSRLGENSKSVVYEMCHRLQPEKRYALKVIGLENPPLVSDKFWENVKIQRILSALSRFVVTCVDAKELVIRPDESGDIVVNEKNEVGEDCAFEENGGIHLQLLLQEKLLCVIKRERNSENVLVLSRLHNCGEIYKLGCQVGQAIISAHENGVLHRDIKLENIFWDENNECYKLGDFDVAKHTEMMRADTVVFTSGYGAPEITLSSAEFYDVRADIYSYGISLYLLLNRLRFPYSDGYTESVIQYRPEYAFPAPEDATPVMARAIRKLTAFDPEDRPKSMDEAWDLLAEAIRIEMFAQEENQTETDVNFTTELAGAECSKGAMEEYECEMAYQDYKKRVSRRWKRLLTLGLGGAVGVLVAKGWLVFGVILMLGGVSLLAHQRSSQGER